MICKHCGSKLPKNASFCGQCGTKILDAHKLDSKNADHSISSKPRSRLILVIASSEFTSNQIAAVFTIIPILCLFMLFLPFINVFNMSLTGWELIVEISRFGGNPVTAFFLFIVAPFVLIALALTKKIFAFEISALVYLMVVLMIINIGGSNPFSGHVHLTTGFYALAFMYVIGFFLSIYCFAAITTNKDDESSAAQHVPNIAENTSSWFGFFASCIAILLGGAFFLPWFHSALRGNAWFDVIVHSEAFITQSAWEIWVSSHGVFRGNMATRASIYLLGIPFMLFVLHIFAAMRDGAIHKIVSFATLLFTLGGIVFVIFSGVFMYYMNELRNITGVQMSLSYGYFATLGLYFLGIIVSSKHLHSIKENNDYQLDMGDESDDDTEISEQEIIIEDDKEDA